MRWLGPGRLLVDSGGFLWVLEGLDLDRPAPVRIVGEIESWRLTPGGTPVPTVRVLDGWLDPAGAAP